MTEKRCPVCSGPVPESTAGRPPTYCSSGCRRAAEYELRRLDRQLERLTDRSVQVQVRLDRYDVVPPEGTRVKAIATAELASVQAAIVRASARLRELLAGPASEEIPHD